jgi:hypothetical protein
MNDNPYISIVATTRNDNHGGDLLQRTTCFVEGIYHQARKFNLSVELILVEWNPPADKPLLKEVLPPPPKDCPVTMRYIIVPNEIHRTFRLGNAIPLFQMIAKNVGIRRAKGEFILCTNIDLLFSDDCFREMAAKKFKEGVYYRANRCDIPKSVMEQKGLEAQLAYAEKNIMERLGRNYQYKHVQHFPTFFFWFPNALRLLDNFLGFFLKKKYEKKISSLEYLDFDACGDFTLMHREDWLKIQGYCEMDLYSLHVDSMALISAAAVGIRQEVFLPLACSYHIYHEDGWASDFLEPDDLIKFLAKRPSLDWHSVSEAGKKLLQEGRPYQINDENWGYADVDLEEYVFLPSGKNKHESI